MEQTVKENFARKKERSKGGYWSEQWRRVKKHRFLLWFILPAAAFTLFFSYVPMLGVLFSFKGPSFNLTKADVLYNVTHGEWTLQNYLDIFVDASFYKAVGNTLVISLIKLALCFPFSIVIAIQLSELKNAALSKLILIIICLPNFLSWAVVIGLWKGLMDAQGGAVNHLLVTLGIIDDNYALMAQNSWFKVMVIFLSAWKGAGWGSIMFTPPSCPSTKRITSPPPSRAPISCKRSGISPFPPILPTIALMLVMNISGIMDAGFEQVYTMMRANAEFEETQIILGTYLYNISVVNRTNIPFATALGVFNGLIALLLMLVGNLITTKTMKRSLW